MSEMKVEYVDHMGVEYVDHMGTDLSVVDAARVSFDKESEWEYVTETVEYEDCHRREMRSYKKPIMGSKHLSEADTKLINYLAKHKHWSPFAHTSIKFRITAPIFVARQLVKHQVGLVWNEVSRRYVSDTPVFYSPEKWRSKPDGSIKQGSGTEEVKNLSTKIGQSPTHNITSQLIEHAVDVYNLMIANNVAPEQARMILPQNMMTTWIWTGSLYAFNRICAERLSPHAQQETREVAQQISDICVKHFPVSWKALEETR